MSRHPPRVGDFVFGQERFQRGFSSHVSHCGYLYEATALLHRSPAGPWATVDENGVWRDHYDRPFTWEDASTMTAVNARLFFQVVGLELVEQPVRCSSLLNPLVTETYADNPVWEVTLQEVQPQS